MSHAEKPFNPLDKRNLAESVVDALLQRSALSIEVVAQTPFFGAGLYALYYTGNFAPYQVIADQNSNSEFRLPIYVGKAVPDGARKGGGIDEQVQTRALFKRLKEHAESLKAVSGTLSAQDFFCRYLIVDDIWIPLGETLVIERYLPLWNRALDGFGNHDPGKGRHNGMRPLWDTLHPGRHWAMSCTARRESMAEILERVRRHLELQVSL